jgi:hypothetical protein
MAPSRLRLFWLTLTSLPARVRFMTGKASFVEADVEMTTNSIAEVLDPPSQARGQRLLAHFRLSTRKPASGIQGWRLYEKRVLLEPAGHQTIRLECGYCGHHYFVQILTALDPLANEATSGRPPGRPASYSSDWFRFMHADYEGEPSLYCLRCEQDGVPSVRHLEGA